MNTRLIVIFTVLIAVLVTGCGGSDVGISTKFFAEKYNAELDQIAREQDKNLDHLKIVDSQSSGTSGFFEVADKSFRVNWHKTSADKNINRLEFSFGTSNAARNRNSVFIRAFANAAALQKEDAKKISEALNRGSDELNIFVEDKNFAVAVNFSPRSGDKTCIIAYGLDAQNDAQILKIKDAAKKEQEYFDKLAEDEKWRKEQEAQNARLIEEANTIKDDGGSFFADSSRDLNITPQEFLAAYNDALTTQGKYDNTDYSKFKPTAVINNPDKFTFNSASARIVCTKNPDSGKICALQTVANLQTSGSEVGHEWDLAVKMMTNVALKNTKANYYVSENLQKSFLSALQQAPNANHFETATDKGVLFLLEKRGTEIRWAVYNENYYRKSIGN